MGTAVVKVLVDNKQINDYGDLYYLKKNDVSDLDRMGEKSAKNLIAAIEKSKKKGLARIIFALGISLVGSNAARLLAEHYRSLDRIRQATVEELAGIDGIGEKMAGAIYTFFSLDSNMAIIEKLLKAGVLFNEDSNEQKSNRLAGLTFVLTGTLDKYTREQASHIIRNNGGNVTSSVSKSTDYLLAGENSGSKLTQAKNLGVIIIDEDEFLSMIGNV
jgi:DNA ligase (NAD+)